MDRPGYRRFQRRVAIYVGWRRAANKLMSAQEALRLLLEYLRVAVEEA